MSRRARIAAVIAAVAALLLVIVAGLVWYFRIELVERSLERIAARYGVELKAELASIRPRTAHFSAITLPAIGLSAVDLTSDFGNAIQSGEVKAAAQEASWREMFEAQQLAADLHYQSQQLRLAASEVTGYEGAIRISNPKVAIADFASENRAIKAQAERLELNLAAPVSLAMHGDTPGAKGEGFAGSFELSELPLEVILPQGRLSGSLSAEYMRSSGELGRGKGQLKLQPAGPVEVSFGGGPAAVSLVSGAIAAAGQIEGGRVQGEARLKDWSGAVRGYAFEAAGATVSVEGEISSGYSVTVAAAARKLALPLPLSALAMHGQFNFGGPAPVLRLKTANFEALGGRFSAKGSVIKFDSKQCHSITLLVSRLALEEITRLYGDSGVSAAGRLSGEIPLAICGPSVEVNRALLSAEGQGEIRIEAPQATGASQADFALSALRHFTYSKLEARLDVKRTGEAVAALKIEGVSHSLNKKTPIVVNLTVEENVFDLLDSLAVAKGVEKQIGKAGAQLSR